MSNVRFESITLTSYRVYSLCCHTLLDFYEKLSDVCDIDTLIGEFNTELRNSYCGDRYDLSVKGIEYSLQKLINKYSSEPDICEQLTAVRDAIRARASEWDFCPAVVRLKDIGKWLAQDFYREGGRATNAGLMESKNPSLVFSNVCLSSETSCGFQEPRPISTLSDEIHLPFSENFGFSHYLSYPLLFFHEYASHVYVPRIDAKRFDDGWLMYAIGLFMEHWWSDLCEKYPLICAHSSVLLKIWQPRFTNLASKGYDIASYVDMCLGGVRVGQPDVFSSYETGLRQLFSQMGQDHPRYPEALTYQQRLIENISQSRQYGDTDTRRSGRAEIIGQLNSLALTVLYVSFNELCGLILCSAGDHDRFFQITWNLASYPADIAGTLSFHDDFLNLVRKFTRTSRGPLLRSAAENSSNALELYEHLRAML